jgi:murein DD-endopeptidase MepM/ murein hydrolase activator NlpD
LRHRDIELHLHPRDPRGAIRSVRLPPGKARLVGALVAGFALLLGLGAAASPRAIRVRLSARDYHAGVALRQELGNRLQALVTELAALEERARRLRQNAERIERAYGFDPDETGDGVDRHAAAIEAPSTIFARRIAEGNQSEGRLVRDLAAIDRSLRRLERFERDRPAEVRALPVGAPVSGGDVVLASGYGPRRSPYTQEMEFHAGIDLAAPRGTPVLAPAAGTVAWAGVLTARARDDWWRLGKVVVIRHGDRFRTIFGHLDAIRVRPGQSVKRGDVLGDLGETGWTTAPALHYEIRRLDGGDWIAVEPRVYLLTLPEAEVESPPRASPVADGPLPQPLPTEFRR